MTEPISISTVDIDQKRTCWIVLVRDGFDSRSPWEVETAFWSRKAARKFRSNYLTREERRTVDLEDFVKIEPVEVI
jgi:hypothetical protein